MSKTIPWTRVLAEGAVIVLSILLAFGIDAGWERRSDRVAERAYLEQLRFDASENVRRLTEALEEEQGQLSVTEEWLGAMRTDAPIQLESARTWADRRAGFYSDPRLLEGTFTALIDGGNLNLVSDDRIRTAILASHSQLRADQADFGRHIDRHAIHLDRFLGAAESELDPDTAPGESPVVRAIIAGQDNLEVRASVRGMVTAYRNRITYLRRMLAASEDLLDVLS